MNIKKNKLQQNRLTWNEYFMKLSWLVSERSTCLRHKIGAVITKDRRILTTGYNGAPTKTKDCFSLGCLRNKLNIKSGQNHEICRAIHAEQNAILQCGYHGITIKNSILYCTHSPCILCAKMIANSGIKKVFIEIEYPDKNFESIFLEAKIKFYKLKLKI
jgi:dCMP deaminase